MIVASLKVVKESTSYDSFLSSQVSAETKLEDGVRVRFRLGVAIYEYDAGCV